LNVNVRYTYRGIYLDDKTPGKRIEPFDYFSAHIDLTLRPWITVYLGARNIFDEAPPVDPEDYESGHMESMLDSTQGAFYYSGVRLTF
jgi:outer membrane receptor protein involved in Fe transport